MIRYDWNVLRYYTYRNILSFIYYKASAFKYKEYPKVVLIMISKMEDMSAYLLNPIDLVLDRHTYTENEFYLYLELAAYRSYINYKETGSLELPTDYIKTKYDLAKLANNKLLIVTDETISFKYEEIKHG